VSSNRVTATDRVRAEIDGVFADPERELGEVLEEVARLSVRLVMQSALEAEVTEFLGRERYARGERSRAGSRNGYSDITVKTTAGAIPLKRPKVRGTLETFSSRRLGKHVTRTNAISGWVRGLSDRDIEAALREALGPDATVSKSTVSRTCEQIKEEFALWRTHDLSEVSIDYLYVDASHFKIHDGARSEPVLVACGVTTEGTPVILHLDGVSAESTDACVVFLEDMVARGLGSPVLTISDGSPGLCAALDQVFPHARRQRWMRHRCWNTIAKVPEIDQPAVRADYWEIFDIGDDIESGEPAVAAARRRARQFEATRAETYPGAVACVTDTLDELVAQLHYPRAHRPRIRHSNLIERTFGETRRRVKVIGRLPGERSALSLLWAVLDRAAGGWRGPAPTPPRTSGYCR